MQIPKVAVEDLGLTKDPDTSKTRIVRYLSPRKRPAVQFIDGEPRQAAAEAARILVDVERVI